MLLRHPKYYKELRKRALDERNRDSHVRPISGSSDPATDQAISPTRATAPSRRAPGPGLKRQALDETVPHCEIEEASSAKLTDPQATSDKHQAPRHKRQA